MRLLRLIAAVFSKETIDHLRDRRSLASALLFPLIGPISVAITLSFVARWESTDRPLEIAVVGRQYAPNLCGFLESVGAKLTEAPADYEKRIRSGDLAVALVIPDDYGRKFESGHVASVEVVDDASNNRTHRTVARTLAVLRAFSHQTGALRLLARGVSPELGEALQVEEADVSTPQQHAAALLAMIPMLLLIGSFMGGMHVAIDSMAGERERGSLEPLLTNPVGAGTLVVGKWLATVLAGNAGVVVMLGALTFGMHRVPLEQLGMRITLGWPQIAQLLATVIPMVFLAGAVQMLIATFARSFREAQTYVSVVLLVPMLPAIAVSLNPIKPQDWMYCIPTLSQNVLMTDIMRGDPTAVWRFVAAAIGTLLAAGVCLYATSRLLVQERIVFGR